MEIKEHMDVVGSDGQHVRTVDKVEGDRIKLTKRDSGDSQHHFLQKSLVTAVDGNTVKLSTYLGKQAVLLDFCATWCEPCVAEFPHLRRIYDGNKDKGFAILAIAMDGPDTVSQVPAFAKRNQLNFPVVTDEDSRIASIYNPKKSAPLSVLIDKQGRIVSIHEGYNPGDENDLAEEVRKTLDAAAAPK